VLHLYIFYSKLEKNFNDTLALELEGWTAPNETSVKKTEWRNHNEVGKGRRTEAGDSAGGGNGGGGDNDGPVEVAGFNNDCNWFTKVMKWRNEAAEVGTEAVAIPGKDEIQNMGLLQFNEKNIISVS
jgi:hypothetical protein